MTDEDARAKAYQIGQYPAVNQDAMLLGRAAAIQAYANLEMSLSLIFAHWLQTPMDVAGLVYFRITNTHARNRILDDLKRHRLQNQYNIYWNSLISLVRTIDQRRNEIVHWHVVNHINLERPHHMASTLALQPPAGWASASSASLNEADLTEFVIKCDFSARSITMFRMFFDPRTPKGPPWSDIFSQPIVYPPPDTHPLSRNYKAPETPPPP